MNNVKLMAKSINMNELDHVAGGNLDQCMSDMILFEQKLGIKLYSATANFWGRRWPIPDNKSIDRLKKAFASYGIEFVAQREQDVYNEYYINDEEVCRQEVWERIEAIAAKKKG